MIIELIGASRRDNMLVLPFVYVTVKVPLIEVRFNGLGMPTLDPKFFIWDTGSEAEVAETAAVTEAGIMYVPEGHGKIIGAGNKEQESDIVRVTFKVGDSSFSSPLHVVPHVHRSPHVVGALGFPFFYENSHHQTTFENHIYVSEFTRWDMPSTSR